MKKLKIQNFKCFEKKTIKFSDLTVLAGGNGAGKSSIIQSLLLLKQTYEANNHLLLSSKLYLNDYYCELGSAKELRYKDANSDEIIFKLVNDYGNKIEIECNIIKSNLNIFGIKSLSVDHKEIQDSFNFLKYFEFISADRFGPKTFHHTDSNFSIINVGKYGEYTAVVLHYNWQKTLITGGDLLSNVNYWLDKIFGNVQIETNYLDEANIAMIKVRNHKKGDFKSPVNMPYGVSYLLPIIVSCLVRQIPKKEIIENYIPSSIEEKDIVVIENPEAHLHPSAQSKLGYFLAKMSKYVQIITETHSEHIINGIRLATLEEDVNQEEIIINFLESDEESIEPNIEMIKVDEFSDLTDWPEGFFDQQEVDIRNIFEARRKNKK